MMGDILIVESLKLKKLNNNKKGVDMEGTESINNIKEYVRNSANIENILKRDKKYLDLVQKKEKLKKENLDLEIQLIERALQLHQADTELKNANNKLEDIDKVKIEFLQISSHEIRTPLNGIFGSLYLMKETEMPEECRKFLNMMEESVKRLERFYKKASLLTAINTDSYELSSKKFNFSDLVLHLKKNIEIDLINKDLSIILDINKNNTELKADLKLLKFCLKEIIINSVNYSEKGGEIRIKLSSDNGNNIIEIIDEGKGFEPKFLNKPLSILSTGQDHFDDNVGLSLAIVNLAVKKHKGQMEIGNNSKKGAYVKLILPDKIESYG